MKFKSIALRILVAVIFISCSDDNDNNANCEDDDFGYVKLNVPSANVETSVIFTEVGTSNFHEEIIEPNETSDTFEVDSGIYTVSVVRISEDGEAIGDPVIINNVVVEPCETTERTINAA